MIPSLAFHGTLTHPSFPVSGRSVLMSIASQAKYLPELQVPSPSRKRGVQPSPPDTM
ncbi:hypothetical protein IFR05_004969 [Cadophora sp. M221]|nr:hypothetical protein IFR05_004969 [Cadophora sp. M221]